MPVFNNGKLQTYYRWEGLAEGPVLVLSHSLGCSSEMWQGQVKAFGDRFRILLYDHRGHGRSDVPAGHWTIGDFGKDLLAFLDHLALESVRFCGLSLGGMVGMWIAKNAHDRIERMALCNTSAKTENSTLLRERIRLIEESGLAAITDNVVGRWFTEEFRKEAPDRVTEARRWLEAASSASYAATSRAVCDLDLTEGLSSIEIPTLVVYGLHDQATPPTWNLRIADAIPGAEAVGLNSAHLSNIEAQGEFNRAVSDFLAG